jgi:hypothetical protein
LSTLPSREGEKGAAAADRGAHVVDCLAQRPTRRVEPAAVLLERDLHDVQHRVRLVDPRASSRDPHAAPQLDGV